MKTRVIDTSSSIIVGESKRWDGSRDQHPTNTSRSIQRNLDQTRYLASLVDASPALERAAPVPLNVVRFRYVRPGLDDTVLDAVNKQIIAWLEANVSD